MIYRCSAQFVQAFDRLPPEAQAQALRVMQRFVHTPLAPTRDVHMVRDKNPTDVWDLPFAPGYHLTYSFLYTDEDEDNAICLLRAVGASEQT